MANKTFTPTLRTALVLLFALLGTTAWAGATWIGNSYINININGTWYNGSGSESWASNATSEEQQGVRSIRLNYGEGEQTAIYTPLSTRSGAEDEVLYTLDGRRLSSRPTAPGIYVSRSADGRQQGKGGRKVIIR